MDIILTIGSIAGLGFGLLVRGYIMLDEKITDHRDPDIERDK